MRQLPLIMRLSLALFIPAAVGAQSLTDGGLSGTVTDLDGIPIAQAAVTLERGGLAYRVVTTDAAGRFRFDPLGTGRYAVLAEQVGFQPVRVGSIVVLAGRVAGVPIRLERRPPPISAPTEVLWSGGGSTGSRLVEGFELGGFDRARPATDVTRGIAEAETPRDGRPGMVGAAGGLLPSASRLMVDGVEELLLRHPGLPGEGAAAPLFARDGIQTVEWIRDQRDAELRGTPGALLTMQSARGGGATFVRPWASYAGSALGGAAADNPADSSTSSLQAGIALGGALKADTAGWFLRLDYQRLALPTADPFTVAQDGGDITAGILDAATAAGAPATVAATLAPTVRTWEGVTGAGRIDWRFGAASQITARLGVASWAEDAPVPGDAPQLGAGTRLEASDVSAMVAFATASRQLGSETRLGVRSGTREWLGADLPAVRLANEGIAFGGVATLAGDFSERVLDLTQTFLYSSGRHQLKFGGTLGRRAINYDWLPNGGGQADYGSLAGLATGTGAFVRTTASDAAADLTIAEAAAFAQDAIQVTPEIELTLGVRYETQALPDDAIRRNDAWGLVSGVRNDLVPTTTKGAIGPRAGFTWDVGGTGRTVLRGWAGIVPGRFDLATFAEAARADGAVTVRRATGTIGWPGATTGTARTALTLFGPEARQPRSYAGNIALSQVLAPATTVTVGMAFRHTDYLLRRTDLNRIGAPAATGADGRDIWGALEQYGGLIVAAPGSNRRFDEFDVVHGLSSTGFSDYQEVHATLERRIATGLSLHGGYTWSRTEDNMIGQRRADPVDRLSPFDGAVDGIAWDEGVSDLDVPHRVAMTARYETAGTTPIRVAARWRWRSGLPYTPGYRGGVDANGDGSGENDPVAPAQVTGVAGLLADAGCDAALVGGFAARNSCREEAVQAIDLHAAIGLPFGGGGRRVMLTLDAFNLGATSTGIVDRAAVLIDPAGSVSTNGAGQLVLPLVANPNFGQLLARRGDPRLLRIGLRVEN